MLSGPLMASDIPEGARVYIISPSQGDLLTSPVTVRFGLKAMGVAPAGTDRANTGHHHLLVDMDTLPDLSRPLGGDVQHFGGGQTEAEIELSPGEHSLQLVLADRNHVPFGEQLVSEKITIRVE
jgi:hypothetical protein